MPQEIVQRLSDLMVAGGKSERVQKLLDTYRHRRGRHGAPGVPQAHEEEAPIWISLV